MSEFLIEEGVTLLQITVTLVILVIIMVIFEVHTYLKNKKVSTDSVEAAYGGNPDWSFNCPKAIKAFNVAMKWQRRQVLSGVTALEAERKTITWLAKYSNLDGTATVKIKKCESSSSWISIIHYNIS